MNLLYDNKKKFVLPYTIACNFDPELINIISQNNSQGIFKSVFGKLKNDLFAGGRSSNLIPYISDTDFKDYIKLCHDNNLQFNYLINAAHLENQELDPTSHLEILKFINQLVNMGVDAITINSPLLCEVIKQQFPNLTITLGIYARAYTLNHIKRWIELGADEITLDYCVNRDFKTLEQMLIYTKDKNVTLRLIANNLCLHSCPYNLMHAASNSYNKANHTNNIGETFDYCIMKCLNEKIKNPVNLISSEWIRPEDVKYYEALCEKTGNYNMSIKLVERTRTTEFLSRVVTAYANHSYSGNLLDLCNWPKRSETLSGTRTEADLIAATKKYDCNDFQNYLELFDLPEIYIDNNKLDGFLDKFVNNYECTNKICGSIEKNNLSIPNSLKCSYCEHWAKSSISFIQAEVTEWLEHSNCFQEHICSSKIFGKNS